MLLTCQEMRSAEEDAFARGHSAGELMAEAGLGIARTIIAFFPHPGTCIAWCGKGNNAGDALAACTHLQKIGWHIQIKTICPADQLSPLTREYHAQIVDVDTPPLRPGPLIVLDGLLGIGARGNLRKEIVEAVQEIQWLRNQLGAFVFAMDIPTGLDGDTGIPGSTTVQADVSVTIGYPKKGLVADSATPVVGRLVVVDLPQVHPPLSADPSEVATAQNLRRFLPPRNFDSYKGDYGRIGIVAGSEGFYGAARLCSAAAVAAGGGLVTLYATPETWETLSLTAIPEVMVKKITRLEDILSEPLDTLAIGPGCGFAREREMLTLIRQAPIRIIIDADALTLLARDISLLHHMAGERLLTPHPGEFARLDPHGKGDRRTRLEAFVRRFPATVLLKGARTVMGVADHPLIYNTTGNPGMGTGGMGDVLTGVCAALAVDPVRSLLHVGALAAWVCGRSAEMAMASSEESVESLRPTHVIENLGKAFHQLRQGVS